MENTINLHTIKEAFSNAILVTSDNTNIAPDFIEKDYWISLILKRLSESKYVDSIWEKLKTSYKNELSMLAYTEIPFEKEVAQKFKELIKILNKL